MQRAERIFFNMPEAAACTDTATQYALCVEKSACVRAGSSIGDCIKRGDTGEECEALRKGYFECRRAQLDMRARIRGKRFQDFGVGTG
jgi:cytochrome c oxidase assembly factor 5